MFPHVDFSRLGHFHTGSLVRIHEQLVKGNLIIVVVERYKFFKAEAELGLICWGFFPPFSHNLIQKRHNNEL